jgi:hypothetical protein
MAALASAARSARARNDSDEDSALSSSASLREDAQREFEQWFGNLKLKIGRRGQKSACLLPVVVQAASGAVEEVVEAFGLLFREEESCRLGIEAAADSWLGHILRHVAAPSALRASQGSGVTAARAKAALGIVAESLVEVERKMRSSIDASEAQWRQNVLSNCRPLSKRVGGAQFTRTTREKDGNAVFSALALAESSLRKNTEDAAMLWLREQEPPRPQLNPAAVRRFSYLLVVLVAAEEDERNQIAAAMDNHLMYCRHSAQRNVAILTTKARQRESEASAAASAARQLIDLEQSDRSRIASASDSAIDETRLLWNVCLARCVEQFNVQRQEAIQRDLGLSHRICDLIATEVRWRAKIDRSFAKWVCKVEEEMELQRTKWIQLVADATRAQHAVRDAIAAAVNAEEKARAAILAGVDDWLAFCAAQLTHETQAAQQRAAAVVRAEQPLSPALSPCAALELHEREQRGRHVAGEERWRTQLSTHFRTVIASATDPSRFRRMTELQDSEALERLQICVGEGKWRGFVLDKLDVAMARCSEKARREVKVQPAYHKGSRAPAAVGGLRMSDPF